ncbi:ABC transporter permease [Massilia horti]|uniref:ABC transporter permease n=1 Tax=Massilia horti TaxID=2562153 RepID=A0A4Y9T1J1_9BURK|nr:ABC transporter permease [Massilia horti]TFW32860.1 ABC transporter permease [Massilia horti]
MNNTFSLTRWWAIVLKEFLQLRRDRITFAMIIGVPIIQIALFGFAINTDPKHLPTAVIASDHSEFTRSFIAAMRNSEYFDIVETLPNEEAARRALLRGSVLFVLDIPVGFTRDLVKGSRPSLRIDADATDPVAVSSALGALPGLAQSVLQKDMTGALSGISPSGPPAFDVQVHKLYNPESITQYNIVPGLMGVILTMTMVMMTGLAVTRERERGTMENLLAMPVLPLEVTTGKIVPYIAIGLVQVTIILLASRYVFRVPILGNMLTMYLVALLFIAASLAVGIMLSSLAQNQLQGVQLTFFYFLPNILLSGFFMPFAGMPLWAQWIGNALPLTHFNRLVRAILLKGAGWADLWPNVWPMLVFMVVVMAIAVRVYRRTLD